MGSRMLWGRSGDVGILWALGGGLLCLVPGNPRQPMLHPLLGAVILGMTLWYDPQGGLGQSVLRVGVGAASIHLFRLARDDRVARWIAMGVMMLGFGSLGWLGHLAAGMGAVGCSLPGAAMMGLGLDLAGTAAVPMTGAMVLSVLGRMARLPEKWAWLLPGAGYVLTMGALGIWAPGPLPWLLLGGLLGRTLPGSRFRVPRTGLPGAAQVRLELASGALRSLSRRLQEGDASAPDREALLQRAKDRGCGRCTCRARCREQALLGEEHLLAPNTFVCRRPGRIRGELNRSREQLLLLQADIRRREEYRQALGGQLESIGDYLRDLPDALCKPEGETVKRFRMQLGVRSRGRHRTAGDRVFCFPGIRGRMYVLLCDGMGTGPGAAREGMDAGLLLRQLITAGFPASRAMETLNAQLTLRGRAGAVTVDLCEVRLDLGSCHLYKWGAAPSLWFSGTQAEKIGTAGLPPGLSLNGAGEEYRLSLRRGETLILVSDGVELPEDPHRIHIAPDASPGEVAERLLQEARDLADDATAAVVRLRPGTAVPS